MKATATRFYATDLNDIARALEGFAAREDEAAKRSRPVAAQYHLGAAWAYRDAADTLRQTTITKEMFNERRSGRGDRRRSVRSVDEISDFLGGFGADRRRDRRFATDPLARQRAGNRRREDHK